MLRWLRNQRGFSVGEISAAMGITALIAAVALGIMGGALQEGRIRSVEVQAKKMLGAFAQYYQENNQYPEAPATGSDVSTAHVYFFGPGSGVLTQYLFNVRDTVGDANFILVAYAYTAGDSKTDPGFELVLEVKNVTSSERYVHITKTGLSTTAASATTLTGASGSWTQPTDT